jgi:TPR repeat protein
LERQIDTLFKEDFIDISTKDNFHQMRMICNAGVHKNENHKINDGNDQGKSSFIEGKQRQVEDARKARRHFLAVAEGVFHTFAPGAIVPEYSVTELEIQKNKELLYSACISTSPQAKLKAGLVYEAMGDEQGSVSFIEESPNSYTKKGLICPEHQYRHFTYLYELAAESYDSACYISAWESRKDTLLSSFCLDEKGEDWVVSICDLESLYRYGALTCEGRLGDEKKSTGISRLRAAASRGHIEAAAACGTSLYNEEVYEDAHSFLQQAAAQDDVLALRMLFFYYCEGKAVPVDSEKAVKYIQRAIDQGCPEALAEWGKAHFEGVVVEKDAEKGNALLRRAQEKGSSIASQHFFIRKASKKVQKKFIKYGKALQSISQFIKPVSEGPKVGRNDPCPCGSEKKYKKCCGQ